MVQLVWQDISEVYNLKYFIVQTCVGCLSEFKIRKAFFHAAFCFYIRVPGIDPEYKNTDFRRADVGTVFVSDVKK
jgi:hypothetical protein